MPEPGRPSHRTCAVIATRPRQAGRYARNESVSAVAFSGGAPCWERSDEARHAHEFRHVTFILWKDLQSGTAA